MMATTTDGATIQSDVEVTVTNMHDFLECCKLCPRPLEHADSSSTDGDVQKNETQPLSKADTHKSVHGHDENDSKDRIMMKQQLQQDDGNMEKAEDDLDTSTLMPIQIITASKQWMASLTAEQLCKLLKRLSRTLFRKRSKSKRSSDATKLASSRKVSIEQIQLNVMIVLQLWGCHRRVFVDQFTKILAHRESKSKRSNEPRSKATGGTKSPESSQLRKEPDETVIIRYLVDTISSAAFQLRQDQQFSIFLAQCIPRFIYNKNRDVACQVFDAFEVPNPYEPKAISDDAVHFQSAPTRKSKKTRRSKASDKSSSSSSSKNPIKIPAKKGKLSGLAALKAGKSINRLGLKRSSTQPSHFQTKLGDMSRMLGKSMDTKQKTPLKATKTKTKLKASDERAIITPVNRKVSKSMRIKEKLAKSVATKRRLSSSSPSRVPATPTKARATGEHPLGAESKSSSEVLAAPTNVVTAEKATIRTNVQTTTMPSVAETPIRSRPGSMNGPEPSVPRTPMEGRRLLFESNNDVAASPPQQDDNDDDVYGRSPPIPATPTTPRAAATSTRKRSRSSFAASPPTGSLATAAATTVCDTPDRNSQTVEATPIKRRSVEQSSDDSKSNSPVANGNIFNANRNTAASNWSPWSSQKDDETEYRRNLKPRAINLFAYRDESSGLHRSTSASAKPTASLKKKNTAPGRHSQPFQRYRSA